ncbi:Heat shock 70 kDa protein 4 [Fukomys damarensis]|uniref:Heat shock 70 kDa protein 4 n=1 Tax=Fukomys damarensis TaxID=885580 RepID=A0A091CN32_FUKDA|nr:Heat shock 70 kDa protein 4 [Fukomys damarensis]
MNEVMEWMNNKLNRQSRQSPTLNPIVKTKQIEAKMKELTSLCNPTISKPKPKVEPPKRSKKLLSRMDQWTDKEIAPARRLPSRVQTQL